MTARDWLFLGSEDPSLIVLGAPISKASISLSAAWSTPPAFRQALRRFPLWDAEHRVDIGRLQVRDLGDIVGDRDDADAKPAHNRIFEAVQRPTAPRAVVAIIGGDNSLTRPALQGLMTARPGKWGLVTLDAHHDVRPADQGSSNGTPVRELVEAGLPGNRIAQIGIHPFGNRQEFAGWAHDHELRAYPVSEVRRLSIETVVQAAIDHVASQGAELIYADLDVDVVDRAYAPACPASMPAGLTPYDFCTAAFILGTDHRVVAMDLCEVDASQDVKGMTVRLMAQAFMSFCAGLTQRIE